jgi:hypothetical protein
VRCQKADLRPEMFAHQTEWRAAIARAPTYVFRRLRVALGMKSRSTKTKSTATSENPTMRRTIVCSTAAA